jgi:hypothetical protein
MVTDNVPLHANLPLLGCALAGLYLVYHFDHTTACCRLGQGTVNAAVHCTAGLNID